jgi:hypothetical protein
MPMRMKMVAARAMVVAGVVTGGVLVAPGTASADVWSCSASVNTTYNRAQATCKAGFGSYRVAAECNTARWPYTTTIYGLWQSRTSGQTNNLTSYAFGDSYSCHVVRAWTQVR